MQALRQLRRNQIRAVFDRHRRVLGRDGLTLTDVVIILAIIVVLGSILLPATRSAKGTARRLECLNNIRQVGIATLNYASQAGGIIPPLASTISFLKENDEQGSLSVGWPVMLLPALDQTKTLKSIKKNAASSVVQANGRMTVGLADQTDIVVFRCPEDRSTGQPRGKIHYVINFGFIPREIFSGDPNGLHRLGAMSWNGNDVLDEEDDYKISAATGVTWRPNSAFVPSFDDIASGDGASQTILLTENLQGATWYGTETTGLGFGVPVETLGGRVLFGRGQLCESTEKPLNCDFAEGELQARQLRSWTINAELKAAKGTRPRPSSAHAGGVNAIFCDGSGRYLSETIDPLVYIKLITPKGLMYGETEVDPRLF